MSVRYLTRKNFDRLHDKFKTKLRYGYEHERLPYETDEEYRERLRAWELERPVVFTYHGKFHTIEFRSK